MNKDTLCDDLQRLNDEEVQSFFIQDAITLIHKQQAEIEALKLGDIQWSHAFDLAKIEIAELKAEIETLKANFNKENPAKEPDFTVEKDSQDWKGMDGATAFWLIQRHSNHWGDARLMMEEWLEANSHSVKEHSNLVNVVKDHIKDLEECVLILNDSMLSNTADEMKVAIKELKDAIQSVDAKNTSQEYVAKTDNLEHKPVAKVTEHGIYLEYPLGLNLKTGTLLYTHPVKELTDKEIKDVYFNTFNWNFSESVSSPFLDFARAILRKARE